METIKCGYVSSSHLNLLNPSSCSRAPISAHHSLSFPAASNSHLASSRRKLHCCCHFNLGLRLRKRDLVLVRASKPEIDHGRRWLLQSAADEGDWTRRGYKVATPGSGAFGMASSVVTVGRFPNKADVVGLVATVFAQHAQIQKKGGNLTVTDLESTNGTFIDKKHLIPGVATILPPARYITIGNREPFQFPYLIRKVRPVKTKARRRKDPTKKKETSGGSTWSSPESPWVKINTDGCSKGSPGKSAAGGIIRDWEGVWRVGFSGNLGICDSLMAELEAAAFGLELAWNRGYRNVILETDSTAVVDYLVKESVVPSQYGDLVRKCVELKSKDWDCRVEHVKRDANMCADRLANKALKRSVGWIVFDDPPQEVLVELKLDRGGFTWPKWGKF